MGERVKINGPSGKAGVLDCLPKKEFIKKLQVHIRELERGIEAIKAQQSFPMGGGDKNG